MPWLGARGWLPVQAATFAVLLHAVVRVEGTKTVKGRIVIGGAIQLSGRFGRYGEQARNIAQMWKEMVDDDLAFPYDVVFNWTDGPTADEAKELDEAMLVPRTPGSPDVLICPYTSGSSKAVCDHMDDLNVSVLCGVWGGASESIFEYPGEGRGNNLRVQSFSPAATYMAAGLEYAKGQLPGNASVAFIYSDNDPFSKSVCVGARSKAESLGFDIAQDTVVDPKTDPVSGDPTIYQDLADALGKQPFVDLYDVTRNALQPLLDGDKLADVLVACGLYDVLTAVKMGLIARKIRPTFTLMTNAFDAKLMESALPINMLDVFMPTQWAPSMSGSDEIFGDSFAFYGRYKERFGTGPTYHGASFGGFMTLLARALKHSQDTAQCDQSGECELNATALRAAFRAEEVSKDTFYGLVDVDEVGMNANKPMLSEQIQMGEGGTLVLVPAVPTDKIPADWTPPEGTGFPRFPARAFQEVSTDFFNSYCGSAGSTLSEFELLKVVRSITRAPLGTFETPPSQYLGNCSSCPRGKSRPLRLGLCVDCGKGTFAADEGRAACELCPVGSAVSRTGATNCTECQMGSVAGENGMSACQLCELGGFMNETGQSKCLRCEQGTYQNETGRSECVPCLDGAGKPMTTRLLGATSAAECVCEGGTFLMGGGDVCQRCPAGMTYSSGAPGDFPCVCTAGKFMSNKARECLDCPAGMDCPGGGAPPKVTPGNWAHGGDVEDQQYSVYRCVNAFQCPGGEPGTCGEGRDPEKVGCAYCLPGYVQSTKSDGDICNKCGDLDAMPLLLTVLAVLVALGAMTWFSTVDVMKTSVNTVVVMSVVAQMVVSLQWLSVFNNMTFEWVEPFRAVLHLASLLAFRLETLKLGCFLDESNAPLNFMMRLLIFPVLASVLVLMMKAHAHLRKRKFDWNLVMNSLGLIITVLFLTLTLVAFTPFVCLDSPNGTKSMATNPSVTCSGNSDYWALSLLGVIGILGYTVTPIASVCWVTLTYPRMVAQGKSNVIMSRYRFLFQRFKAEVYFYAPLYFLRNFLMALVPVVLANMTHLQILVLAALFVVFGAVSAYFRPWRGHLPNFIEIAVMGLFVLCLVCAGLLQDTDRARLTSDMQVCLSIALSLLVLPTCGVFVYVGIRRLKPPKKYGMFLSHHKRGMAVGCRLLKMELQESLKKTIFLDSDELDDLDGILDIVRTGTETLVVILTSETLWRPWCAGEIVTAHLNHVPVVLIDADSYAEPTDEELTVEALERRWTVEDFAPMTLQGVAFPAVRKAYTALREQEKLPWKRAQIVLAGESALPPSFIESICKEAARQRPFSGTTHTSGEESPSHSTVPMSEASGNSQASDRIVRHASMKRTKSGGSVSRGSARKASLGATLDSISRSARTQGDNFEIQVLANAEDGEAITGAMVLSRMLQKELQKTATEAFLEEDVNSQRCPEVIVVSLTKGAFHSEAFFRLVVAAWKVWGRQPYMMTVRSPDFEFPVREVLEKSIYPGVAERCDISENNAQSAFQVLISSLALPFFPSGNIRLCEAEVHAVAERIKRSISTTRAGITASLARWPAQNERKPRRSRSRPDREQREGDSTTRSNSKGRSGEVSESYASEDASDAYESSASEAPLSLPASRPPSGFQQADSPAGAHDLHVTLDGTLSETVKEIAPDLQQDSVKVS